MGNPYEASASGSPDAGSRLAADPADAPVFHISGTRLVSEPTTVSAVDAQFATAPVTTPPTSRQPSLENSSVTTESSVTDQSDAVSGREATTTTTTTTRSSEEQPPTDVVAVGSPPREQIADEEARRVRRGVWSHDLFSVFATFFSVFGLFSVTRFSLLVYIYKACFILEFLLLSSLFGVPFLYLQMTMGQYLGSGILDMWYISPAFKGVGVALVLAYLVCGVYFAVPISWLFFYFRDSFIKARDTYRWSVCQVRFASNGCYKNNVSSPEFLGWTTASYFQ